MWARWWAWRWLETAICVCYTTTRKTLTWFGAVEIIQCSVPFAEEETQAENGRVGQSHSYRVAEPGLEPRSESKTLFPQPHSCCFTVLRFWNFTHSNANVLCASFIGHFFCLTLLTRVCCSEQMSVDTEVLKSSTSSKALLFFLCSSLRCGTLASFSPYSLDWRQQYK